MKIDESFDIKHDDHTWILVYHKPGRNFDGEDTLTDRRTFHATLGQTMEKYCDMKLKNGEIIPAHIDVLIKKLKKLKLAIKAEFG